MISALTIFKAVPITVWALAGALVWGGFGHYQKTQARLDLEAERRDRAEQITRAVTEARAEDARRISEAERINREQADVIKKQAADLAAADRALSGMRGRLSSIAAFAAGADTTTAELRASVVGLADLAARIADQYRVMGGRAVEAARRGQECADRYDSLTPQRQ